MVGMAPLDTRPSAEFVPDGGCEETGEVNTATSGDGSHQYLRRPAGQSGQEMAR